MFQELSELSQTDGIKFLFHSYYVVDTEHQLALSTTNGRCKNARRWFVHRYTMPNGRADWKAGKVTFRAWSLDEALQRLNEPRIQKRINALTA